jgi:O-antigen/teichoic acid export membrane protein
MLKAILNSGKFVLASNLIERLVSVIIFWLIARVYGAEIYGQIATVFAFSGILDIFFQFGYPIYVQRETAKGSKNIHYIIRQMLSTRVIFSFLFILIALTYFHFVNPELPSVLVLLISSAVCIVSVSQIINAYFYGTHKNKVVMNSIIISRIFLFVLCITLLLLHYNYVYVLIIFFAAYTIQLIYLLLNWQKEENIKLDLLKDYDLKLNRQLIISCLPLAIAMVFNMTYDRVDTVLISAIKDFKQAGFYNAAYSLYKMPLMALSIIFVPAFSNITSISSSKEEVKKEFTRLFRVISFYAVICFCLLFFLADVIIHILYSNNFNESINVLKILSFSFFFLSLNNLTGMMVNSLSLNKPNIYILLSGLLINVLMNLFLINKIGIIGAAYSTLITEFVILVCQVCLINKYLKS